MYPGYDQRLNLVVILEKYDITSTYNLYAALQSQNTVWQTLDLRIVRHFHGQGCKNSVIIY